MGIRGGRRPDAGALRAPSGQKSRSAQARAIEAINREQAAREREAEEQRQVTSAVTASFAARAQHHGLTIAQAQTRHAATVEGRLFLKRALTAPQAEAASQYRTILDRYNRATGAPALPGNPLKQFIPSGPKPSGAGAILAERNARRDYDRAQDALTPVGHRNPYAVWAIGQLCRRNQEPPERLWPALREACQALAIAFGLDSEAVETRERV